ncbi:hypothetical protein QJQ45_007273 [Haematococcus lacustris]|nr:hypothetical protein QJQ45_007273 [Haematococcus lacustris]
MGTPRARELHVPAPHPRAPSDALDLKTVMYAAQRALFLARHTLERTRVTSQLEERLREFKAENQLLGRTLQEVQAERSALERQVQDGMRSAVQLQGQLDASRQACSALQTEAEGLRARLAAQEARLQQVTASRAEVEELVLDMHQRLALQGPDAQPAGQQRGDSSQLRDQMARMEELYASKLQLVQQQSAERVRLQEQEHAQALSRVQSTSLTLVSQLRQEAAKQVEEAQAGIERQAGGRASVAIRHAVLPVQMHDQLRILEQLQKRCGLLESRLSDARSSLVPRSQLAQLQQQVEQLQQASHTQGAEQQAGREVRPPGQLQGQPAPQASQAELQGLRHQVVLLQAACRHLEAARLQVQTEASAAQQQAKDAGTKLGACRSQLVSAQAAQQALQASQGKLVEQVASLTQQLAASEAAVQGQRQDLAHLRSRLLDAQTATMTELLQVAVADVRTALAAPALDSGSLLLRQASGPAATYVRVLEHALSEGEAREAALRKAVAEAEAAEESTRQLLASSRGDLAAGQRALLQQVQRVQALEALRLTDMQAGLAACGSIHSASGSGQQVQGQGQAVKVVIAERRQVIKAAFRGLVEAAQPDFSPEEVDAVVAQANQRMTMGSMQCCLAAVMSLTMLLQSFLGQPTPGFPAAGPAPCHPPPPDPACPPYSHPRLPTRHSPRSAAPPAQLPPPVQFDVEDPSLLPQIKAAMDLLTNASVQEHPMRGPHHSRIRLLPGEVAVFEQPSSAWPVAKLQELDQVHLQGDNNSLNANATKITTSITEFYRHPQRFINTWAKAVGVVGGGFSKEAKKHFLRLVLGRLDYSQPDREHKWRLPPNSVLREEGWREEDPPAPAQEPPPAPPPAQDQPPAQPPPGPVQRPQAPSWGRWLDRDTNPCLNFQRIGESMQRPLELCRWDDLEALPPVGKEYQQRYKLVNDRLPKVRQRLHRAAEYRRGIDGRARNNA